MPGVGYMRFLPALLPECEFINEGACGDTVGGLHRRVRQMRHAPAELALVWIGTNDACRLEPGSELVRWFGEDYERLLVDALPLARRVATVPPLVIGLEPLDYWNRLLEEMAHAIRMKTGRHEGAEFLDLRREFAVRTGAGPELWLDYTEDGAHLNVAGAEVVAGVFADCIGRVTGTGRHRQ